MVACTFGFGPDLGFYSYLEGSSDMRAEFMLRWVPREKFWPGALFLQLRVGTSRISSDGQSTKGSIHRSICSSGDES